MPYILDSIKIYPQIYAYKADGLIALIEDGTQSEQPGNWVGVIDDSPDSLLAYDLDPATVGRTGTAYEKAAYISLTPPAGGTLYTLGITDEQIYAWLSDVGDLALGARTAIAPDGETPSLYWFTVLKAATDYVLPYYNRNEDGCPDYAPLPLRIRYCAHIEYHEEGDPNTVFIKHYPDSTGVHGDASKRAYEVVLNSAYPHMFTAETPSLCMATEITLWDAEGVSIAIADGEADIDSAPAYIKVDFAIQGVPGNNTLDELIFNISSGNLVTEEVVEIPFDNDYIRSWTLYDGTGTVASPELVYSPDTIYRKSFFYKIPGYFTGTHNIIPSIMDVELNVAYLNASAVAITSTITGAQIITPGGSSYIYHADFANIISTIVPNGNTLTEVTVTVNIAKSYILSGLDDGYTVPVWSESGIGTYMQYAVAGSLTLNTQKIIALNMGDLATALGLAENYAIAAALLELNLQLDCKIDGVANVATCGPIYVGVGMGAVEISLSSFTAGITNFNQWNKTNLTIQIHIPSGYSSLMGSYKLPPYRVGDSAIKVKPTNSSGWYAMASAEFYCHIPSDQGIMDMPRFPNWVSMVSGALKNFDVQALPGGQYDVSISLEDSAGISVELTKSVYITTTEPPIQMDAQPDTSEIDASSEFSISST